MSHTFFMILWTNAFFILFMKIAHFLTKTHCLHILHIGVGREFTKNKPHPLPKLYVGPDVQAPILICGRAGLTPPQIPTLLVLGFAASFLFCFLQCCCFRKFFESFSTEVEHSLIRAANMLPWKRFKPISLTKQNWRGNMLFKAEIVSNLHPDRMGPSRKKLFCLQRCSWNMCFFCYVMQPW